MREIAENVVEACQELGITKEELGWAWQNQPVLRSAAMQSLMADAGRWRAAQKSLKNANRPPVPIVQRPGVSQPRDPNGDAVNSALSKFRADPSPKNAAALLLSRRNSR
jgi:hypothetical protein